jgi:hypothetical protein
VIFLRHAATFASAAEHQCYLWGYAPAFRRGAGRCSRRPDLPGRAQRLRQVYLAAHCDRAGPARCGDRFAQPGATIHYLPQEPNLFGFATTLAYVEAGFSAADDSRHRALHLLKELGLSGEEDPAALSGGEARRAARKRRTPSCCGPLVGDVFEGLVDR